MPLIRIDGAEYEVEAGGNLLQTALELGLDLPYFCWHPALGSAGACRQCAVVQYRDEEDDQGRIVMSCMTPVTDGAVFSLSGDKAGRFREAVVESLMLNHPHDCPVCAEGGECHLQDMTVMVGHRDRHYRGRKNTHRNQYLGPLIHHEMNRCITCYRCTRYYRDYAGGTDLAELAARDHVYFGRHREGTLESPFAGNLVEVCPTGVFTDKSLVREYTRKWDLQSAPSVCVGCAVGCNTLPGERYGKLKRIHNRYNAEVNGYFLCDRGRFGGGFVNSPRRLDYPATRQRDGRFRALSRRETSERLAALCRGKRLAGIGSPRASVESNFLLRQLVGADNFCSGIDDGEQALSQRVLSHLGSSPARNPCPRDMERADAVLILGEDITQTAPRLALSLRQSVRNRAFDMAAELRLEPWQDAAVRNLAQDARSPLYIVSGGSTALDDVAAGTHCLPLADQARFAHELAGALRGEPAASAAVGRIAGDLRAAERPLVLCGVGGGSAALVDAAAEIAGVLAGTAGEAMLSYCLSECNSMGSALLTRAGSAGFAALAERSRRAEIDVLVVLENDLRRRAGASLIHDLREQIPAIVSLDCLESPTLAESDLVLPAAAFTECEGTLINAEGRAQRFFPTHPAAAERRAGWQWLLEIAAAAERPDLADLHRFDDVVRACADADPALAGIAAAAPDHEFRSRGLKVPRQPHRYSGRTAMLADVSVHEPKQTADEESALAFTMEGSPAPDRPGALLSYVWSPGWNSNQALHKFQGEVGGSLRGGTPGVRLLDEIRFEAPPAAEIPAPFRPRPGEFQLQPRARLFGSDELSRECEGIAQLAEPACIEINRAAAAELGVTEGDGLRLCQQSFEVRIDDSIPAGCAGYPAGYVECAQLRPGQWVPLSRDESRRGGRPRLIGTDRDRAGTEPGAASAPGPGGGGDD